MLRKCKGRYYKYSKDVGVYKPINFELGYFHTWGNDYEEFETGAGNYSIAIVELPDGKIVKVNPNDLKFLDTKEYLEPLEMKLTKEKVERLIESSRGVINLCQN